MNELLAFAAVSLSAVFFVVDPIGVVPIFIGLTEGNTDAKKRATARKAAVAATLTLLVFAAAGGLIFRAFGITIGAFQIAGGVLLFRTALDMMHARHDVRLRPDEQHEGELRDDIGLIPLTIPLLAGPGAIATVMVVTSNAAGRPAYLLAVFLIVIATGGLTWVLLRSAVAVAHRLGTTGLNAVTRIMGLLLAAVAVQFAVNGFHDVLPQILAK
jgi:multiple antibiotic resistance protein